MAQTPLPVWGGREACPGQAGTFQAKHATAPWLPCLALRRVVFCTWQLILGNGKFFCLVYFCGFAAMDLALSHYFGAFFLLGYCRLSLGRKLYFSI